METWKVEHCPHFHQEIAYQASPRLPRACVTFFIKVALVSPMLCPIWAMDSSVKSSSQANSSPSKPYCRLPSVHFLPLVFGLPWCPLMPLTVGARAGCHCQFKLCYCLCHCLHPSILTSTCPHQNVASTNRMVASRSVDGIHRAETPYPRQEPQQNFDRQFKTLGELGHRGVGDGMMAHGDLNVSSLEGWKSFSLWTASFKFQPSSKFCQFTQFAWIQTVLLQEETRL